MKTSRYSDTIIMVLNHRFQSTRLRGRVLWNLPFSVMFYVIIQSSPETLNQINSLPPHGATNNKSINDKGLKIYSVCVILCFFVIVLVRLQLKDYLCTDFQVDRAIKNICSFVCVIGAIYLSKYFLLLFPRIDRIILRIADYVMYVFLLHAIVFLYPMTKINKNLGWGYTIWIFLIILIICAVITKIGLEYVLKKIYNQKQPII